MADFAPARAAQERDFADREGREVVVEHEALPRLALEALDLLRVVGGAERAGDERLRLAAREDGRAVGARQHAGLDPDRPDFVELAAVEPDAVLEHLVAQHLFLQLLEDVLRLRPCARPRPRAATRPARRAPRRRGRSSRACRGCASPRSAARAPSLRPRGRSRGRSPSSRPSASSCRLSLARSSIVATICLIAACAASSASTTCSSVTSFAPASTITRPSLLPATTRSSLLCLRCSKVGLMTYWPSTRPTRTPAIVFSNGNLGERERRRGAGDGEHVGVVLGVGRQHERDDLRLVAPAGREERPDRPVDDAARQDFLFGRLAFALEEAAGNAPRRVGVFAVVDRQRQEVDALARVGRAAGRDEHDRIAEADDDRAAGLLGELAGFESRVLPPMAVRACASGRLLL